MQNETNSIQPDETPETQPDSNGTSVSDTAVIPDTGETVTDDAAADDAAADDAAADASAVPEDGGDDEEADDEDEADFRGILEALIFASDEPLTFKQIKELLAPNDTEEDGEAAAEDAPGRRRRKTRRLTITRVKRAIDRLNDEFTENGRVFRIVEVAGGFAFQTTKDYGAWVGRLFAERSRRRLTQSALETLAIIAFKQPISKPAIEGIRGVNAEYVVKSLLERNLISIVGREDSPGRPLLYGTTKNFLKHFGLSSINDLPKPREIKDLLSSEEELGVNPIDEMDPEAAALLTRVSSQELEKLFETAQTKAEKGDEGESGRPPVLRVQFDSEFESESESEGEFESESESEGESEEEYESAPGDELEPEFEDGEDDDEDVDVEDEFDEEDDISDTDEKEVT
ncbi:MAG: SMC-Scp complex subunit ScpB [Bacteroidetes bacterium]|nr:SMC-Scp complex subunit ScpB [Bacteroidota bacterium]